MDQHEDFSISYSPTSQEQIDPSQNESNENSVNSTAGDGDPIDDSDTNVLVKVTRNEDETAGKTSTFGSVFLIVNAALGAGLLNFPQAFDQAGGVLVAVIVQAVLLVFIMIALIILAQTANIKNSATLQDVMFTATGVWGRRATSLIIALYCFGTCITFLIIIGDQFDRALASMVGPHFCDNWYFNRNFLMPFTSVILILPMCYTKKIDFLKYASIAGVFAIVYVEILIIQEFFAGGHVKGEIKTAPTHPFDFFLVMPVICFGYQCHVSVIPIYSCMKHRTTKHFSIAAFTAIAVCVATYTGAATFGYLTFGSLVKADILSNYSASKPTVMIALIMMALKTYTTYPILLFCGREGISSIIKDLSGGEESEKKELIRRIVIASVWFVCSIVLAVAIPNIGAVIKILGSLAAVFIFIFPGLCLLQTSLATDARMVRTNSKLKVALAAGFLIIGSFIFGVVLAQGLIFDLSSSHGPKPFCVPR